jgi:hypothetical protein
MNKGKKGATKPKIRKSTWVTDVLKDFGTGAGETTDLLNLSDAPDWVWNALEQVSLVLVPGGVSTRENWDAAFLGELLGRLHGLEMMLSGQVPLGPETTAELEMPLQRAVGKLKRGDVKKMEKDFAAVVEATQNAIAAATTAAIRAPHHEKMAFHKALSKGMDIQPDDFATSRTLRRHTRTFLVLAIYWRNWVKCRSVREVYDHLCKSVGEHRIGSFKTFENHVVKKIGFKVRESGRSKSAK